MCSEILQKKLLYAQVMLHRKEKLLTGHKIPNKHVNISSSFESDKSEDIVDFDRTPLFGRQKEMKIFNKDATASVSKSQAKTASVPKAIDGTGSKVPDD